LSKNLPKLRSSPSPGASDSSESESGASSSAKTPPQPSPPPPSPKKEKKKKKEKKEKKVTPPPPSPLPLPVLKPLPIVRKVARWIPPMVEAQYRGQTLLKEPAVHQQPSVTLKFVICGDSGVGKTSLLWRVKHRKFDAEIKSTIGVDFLILFARILEEDVQVQAWDTAGQERFRALASAYYRHAHAVIIAYDICSERSFMNVPNYISEAQQNASNPLIILVGNKSDRAVDERAVTFERAKEFAVKHNFCLFEVSACDGNHVDDMFVTLIELAYREKVSATRIATSTSSSSTITLKDTKPVKEEEEEEEDQEKKPSCSC
jgi:small GTP-binding protein